MDLNLHRLSYDEFCRMELLPMEGNENAELIVTNTHSNDPTALMPIMVIPGDVPATSAATAVAVATVPVISAPKNYYQLLATSAPQGAILLAQAKLTPNNNQQQQQQQQKGNFFEKATLMRQSSCPTPTLVEESDFEGSECGASVSNASTCIPHLRFNACGMMLQPVQQQQQTQHQQQQQHAHQLQQYQKTEENAQSFISCSPLTNMMGSLGAFQSGRLMGGGHSETLGRRLGNQQKRVSFKADIMPSGPYARYCGDWSLKAATPPPPIMDSFHNLTHFDNFMDYQTASFGGLPDVTEHSNGRCTSTRQNFNTCESVEEKAHLKKSKMNFVDGTKAPSIVSFQNLGNNEVDRESCSVGSKAVAKRRKKKKITHDRGTNETGTEHHLVRPQRGIYAFVLTLLVGLCLLGIAALLVYKHFIVTTNRNSYAQRLGIVQRILHDVPLVDGHNNFAWSVKKYAYNSLKLLQPLNEHNQKETWNRPTWAQTDITRLRQGLIGMQVWSIHVPCEAQGMDAVQLALEQIDIIRRLTEIYEEETVLVESSKQVMTVHRQGFMASLIGIEGGHTISSSLAVLRSFYSLGARYMSLTHTCELMWASSAASPMANSLTPFGKAVVSEMNRLGMMIDLSYSSDATAREVLQITRAPVIFSHSGARHLCNSTHNISDEILRLVAENGGLIMISFHPQDVACGRRARLQDVIAHIRYVRAIAGIQHIGLSAGYDGIQIPPVGLEDVTRYPDLLASLLEDHNWTEEDIAMLAGKNFLRIFETVENVRDYWKGADIQPVEQTEPQAKGQCNYMSS